MTSEYRLEFTLSTLSPKGDVDDDSLSNSLIAALREVAAMFGAEILWSEFTNITDELEE